MIQPSVSRCTYGYPAMPTGESGLPSGGPLPRGEPLDPDIPGHKTYTKQDAILRRPGKGEDESIHRIDDPDDLLKDQTVPDVNESNADKHDGLGWSGGGKQDSSPKTTYPYRDGVPNAHNAAHVVGLYLLASSPERTLTAARISEIERDLSKLTQERARRCQVVLKRADIGNLRWIFAVNSGSGPKIVRLKAARPNRSVKLTKMDLRFSCSCPSWRWQGPEFHATQGGFLDGKPRGTASSPDVTDPARQNRVCKHVAAVIDFVRGWEVPAA